MASPFTSNQLAAMTRDEVNLRLYRYKGKCVPSTGAQASVWYDALAWLYRDFCRWLYWELPPNTTAVCGAYTAGSGLAALIAELELPVVDETDEEGARRALSAINDATNVS